MTDETLPDEPRDFPEMLEILAEWLDYGDAAFTSIASYRGEENPVEGDAIQRELRILAEKVKDHPEVVSLMTGLMFEARDEALAPPVVDVLEDRQGNTYTIHGASAEQIREEIRSRDAAGGRTLG